MRFFTLVTALALLAIPAGTLAAEMQITVLGQGVYHLVGSPPEGCSAVNGGTEVICKSDRRLSASFTFQGTIGVNRITENCDLHVSMWSKSPPKVQKTSGNCYTQEISPGRWTVHRQDSTGH